MISRDFQRKTLAVTIGFGVVLFCAGIDWAGAAPTENAAQAGSAPSEAKPKDSGKGATSLFETSGNKNEPIYIKSNTLTLDSKGRTFTYDGNVEVVQGDLTITAATMIGVYDEKNRIRTITCKDNVVITKGADMKANANRALYNVLVGTIELTENPELINKGNALSADKITIFVEEERSEAEGDVRVRVVKAEGEEKGSGFGGLFPVDTKAAGSSSKGS